MTRRHQATTLGAAARSDKKEKRAARWGRDQAGTRTAVEVFVPNDVLERFLELVWRR